MKHVTFLKFYSFLVEVIIAQKVEHLSFTRLLLVQSWVSLMDAYESCLNKSE